jgi:hypothetical protein
VACLDVVGWGITLKIDDGCDWKPGITSSAFAISYGADGTGDLTVEANMRAFAATVAAESKADGGGGVRLVVADGERGVSILEAVHLD